MKSLIIAIALDDGGTIAQHAGRASLWQIYATEGKRWELVWTLACTAAGSLHEWHVRGDGDRHPLHNVDVVIAGSAGDGVVRNLAQRDTQLITTDETDPKKAISAYLSGRLTSSTGEHREKACQNHWIR